ncbi:uncharacterized protein mettl21ca [Genypterus blacodes]|uniref:uncharacterized protein mettl21ca n=1 Tax=Genypterus blacodes TaxID=154954 RepID=UPI003F777798
MATLSTHFVGETREEREGEEEEGVDENEEVTCDRKDDSHSNESAVQHKQRPAWAPCFYMKADKEVHYYAGQEIVIEESIDSYGGNIWPAALSLCHYLDTHREQLNLMDKAVLEIGAGTGLLSVVAALLGAWVTATDLPNMLSTLRVNLSRNTRGRCRHTPQVAALSWDHELEQTYPTSIYHYDYVLAADVVYHHDFLDELLATMKHFCRPGTTLVWANKVRFGSDLSFTENFKKAFDTRLLVEDAEMKIFMATCREAEEEDDVAVGIQDQDESDNKDSSCSTTDTEEDDAGKEQSQQTAQQQKKSPAWTPTTFYRNDRDIYHYVGHDICIYESIDYYGAVMWPAALALCSYLENNRELMDLQGKKVLELGAGTGLVTIVASLLGASVTATDLPDIQGNLRANVMRNTRGQCRHTPQVDVLSWGYDVEDSHPKKLFHYDFVLAADVVYQHDFLSELLATMKHFCQPGTTLIWANKVRLESDLAFTKNFEKAFHTSLLFEDGDMKIFQALCREREPVSQR